MAKSKEKTYWAAFHHNGIMCLYLSRTKRQAKYFAEDVRKVRIVEVKNGK